MLMRVSRCMRRRRCWLSVACSPYFPWGFTLGFVLLARWSWKSLGYFCGIANKCMFSVPVVGAQATEAGRSAVVFYWSLKCMGQKVEYTGSTKYDWVFWEIHSIWTFVGGLTGSYRNCELRKGQNDKAEVMGERSLVSHMKKKLFSEFGKVE